jgi:hypothetical protein
VQHETDRPFTEHKRIRVTDDHLQIYGMTGTIARIDGRDHYVTFDGQEHAGPYSLYPSQMVHLTADDEPAHKPVTVSINEHAWRPHGPEDDPTSSLIAEPTLTVCGVAMHVAAYAVAYRPGSNEMYFVEDPHDDHIGRLWTVTQSEGVFDTTEINGREYVIVAYPHT